MSGIGFHGNKGYEDDRPEDVTDATKKLINELKKDPPLDFLGGKQKMDIKSRVIRNDQILRDMAMYAVTNGGMDLIDIRTQEDLVEFQTKVQKKFREFKQLVRKKSFTLKKLEIKVFKDYGAL